MLRERYRHWQVADGTIFITTLGGTHYMYLLEGRERALLIDTAYGCGQLRRYVEQLTGKPVLVVNTHGHPDHTGGNGWWQEVHMHADAAEDIASFPAVPGRLESPWPDYARAFIEDGFVFDLGGREVQVVEIPAHAPGSLALLDRQARMLFSGDEIESGQVLLFDYGPTGPPALDEKAAKHLRNMLRLKAMQTEFSFICPTHNGAPIAPFYLDDFIELDRALLEDRATIARHLSHWYLSRLPFARDLRRATHGSAAIVYRDSQKAVHE
jgi:hydroxyacylglutathione hydrolase